MPSNTTRLALPQMQGPDQLSSIANTDQAAKAILDTAAVWHKDVLANRPAAGAVVDGYIFEATDTGVIYIGDGSNWHEYESALSTWKPYCVLGAQVGSAVSATRFFSPGNVAGTGAALAACLFPINITGLVAGSRTTQWRLVWAGQVNVVAPVVTFTIAMYGASSSAGGSGSGSTVSKGTLVAGSGTTWVTPTGGLTSANNIGPTFTVAASGSYVIAVDPSVATAANSVTDFVVTLQYQQV